MLCFTLRVACTQHDGMHQVELEEGGKFVLLSVTDSGVGIKAHTHTHTHTSARTHAHADAHARTHTRKHAHACARARRISLV